MALARMARSGVRRSGVAIGNITNRKETFCCCEGLSKNLDQCPSPFNGITTSTRKKVELEYYNLWRRGMRMTPHHHQSAAQAQRIIEEEESDSEKESTDDNYPTLEATKPGEKPRVVVLGSGWAACRFLKGLDTKTYDVVCISPRNHMVFTPLLASTCVGTLEFRSVMEPVNQIQKALANDPNSYFFLASCTGIDTHKHEVSSNSWQLLGKSL